MNNKPRKPWLAAILTLFSTGLGHIYAGKPLRGFILFAIVIFFFSFFGISTLVFPNIYLMTVLIICSTAFGVFCIVDAFSIAKKGKETYEPAKYNRWFVYLGYYIVTFIILFPIHIIDVVKAYKIPARSMSPTLLVGDHILIYKSIPDGAINVFGIFMKKPQRGEIVVHIYPNDRKKDFVKRVIGMGGDKIEIKNKKVFINGAAYNDTHGFFKDSNIIPGQCMSRDNFGPVIVPDNAVFVLGDNRDESLDSRFWGFVDLKDVRGKVFMIYWSWDRDKHEVRWDRFGKLVE